MTCALFLILISFQLVRSCCVILSLLSVTDEHTKHETQTKAAGGHSRSTRNFQTIDEGTGTGRVDVALLIATASPYNSREQDK